MKIVWSVSGVAGILYGFGIGSMVAVALPYLECTSAFSSVQLSSVVAAAMIASLVTTFAAGPMAEWWGRRRLLLWASLGYALGTPFICLSGGAYALIVTGLAIQGLAMGVHCVIVPLYLTETLPPETRGRGAAVFQLFIIIGILLSGGIGLAAAYVFGAADSAAVSIAAKAMAWKSIFAFVAIPAVVLFFLSFFLPESPVWLQKRKGGAVAAEAEAAPKPKAEQGSIFQKRYMVPFFLVIVFLICQQGLGMNSVCGYSVKIFQQAGFSGAFANWADLSFKVVMLVMTVLSLVWVDTKGRLFLLKIGSGGCAVGLFGMAAVFFAIRSGVLAASSASGVLVALSVMVYVATYALGPGVCMWLLTTELLPNRIRAVGLGVATLFDGLVSSVLQASFLPFTEKWGYAPFFVVLALFAVVYFILVAFCTPETKGKSLEEIEEYWNAKFRK